MNKNEFESIITLLLKNTNKFNSVFILNEILQCCKKLFFIFFSLTPQPKIKLIYEDTFLIIFDNYTLKISINPLDTNFAIIFSYDLKLTKYENKFKTKQIYTLDSRPIGDNEFIKSLCYLKEYMNI